MRKNLSEQGKPGAQRLHPHLGGLEAMEAVLRGVVGSLELFADGFVLPFRLQGAVEPGGGGGAAGEGVRITRGLLQTQIPRPARQVSSPCPPQTLGRVKLEKKSM